MSRLLTIASREYLAYVRTVGFWLSIVVAPLSLLMFALGPALLERTSPIPTLAVIDLTSADYAAAVAERLKTAPARRRRPPAVLAPSPIGRPADAATAGVLLRPYLKKSGGLDAAAIIHDGPDGSPVIDFWSRNLADRGVQALVRDAVAERMTAERLRALGVPPGQIEEIASLEPRVTAYSPRAQLGRVGLRDRLPGFEGFAIGMLLWISIFSGAGILLNSVIEEKSSRVLEVLMASASVPEIMGGKILGVAGVTATVLGLWLGAGAVAGFALAPQVAADIVGALLNRGLVVYFAIFLMGGYLTYAALFTAIGAFCETTREAQTLLAPVMLLLTVPILFMTQAIVHPDAPLVAILSWIPPFTPFLMPARIAAEPPAWELAASAGLMAATAAASLWLSARAFAAGALSNAKPGPLAFFTQFLRGAR